MAGANIIGYYKENGRLKKKKVKNDDTKEGSTDQEKA